MKSQAKYKNPLGAFIVHLIGFDNIAPRLLHNETMREYIVWFEKLERYDKRALYLYLCAHADELTKEEHSYSVNQLKLPISKEYSIKDKIPPIHV